MHAHLRYVLAVIGVLVVAAAGYGYYASPHPMAEIYATRQVSMGTATIAADIADTEQLREQGLSGRTSLSEGKGMFFLFEAPGRYGFWMKDMRFSLDIIWAAPDGTIVSIDHNLSPNTYPQVFYPAAPAQYVLEVPAGFAAKHAIVPGMALVVK